MVGIDTGKWVSINTIQYNWAFISCFNNRLPQSLRNLFPIYHLISSASTWRPPSLSVKILAGI